MLTKIRRRYNRGLAADSRTRMHGHLDNIVQVVEEIRALPEGASATELTARLITEAVDADLRSGYVDELIAKAGGSPAAA